MKATTDRDYTFSLALLTLLGFSLRALLAWRGALMGDEVGTWLYIARDYGFILSNFLDPWLSMGPFIACTKAVSSVLGDAPWALRLLPVLAGTLTIPLTAAVIRRLDGKPTTALVGALLMACNSYAVGQGANARSYAMVLLFTLWAFHALLGWWRQPRWSWGWAFAAAASLSLLSQFCTVYFLAALAVLFLWCRSAERGLPWTASFWTGLSTLVIPVAIAIAPAVAYYTGIFPEMRAYRDYWGAAPPAPVNYLADMVGSYFGLGWRALPALLLALGGWIADVRLTPRRALVLGVCLAVPVFLYAASGTQIFPWASTRYLVFLLPLLLIQMSFGLARLGRTRLRLAAALALVLATWWPGLRTQLEEADQLPWRAVHAYLEPRWQPGDAIIAPGHGHLHLLPGCKAQPWRVVPARDYVKGPSGQTQQLFMVTVQAPLDGASHTQRFGNIFVHEYQGSDRSALARQVVQGIQQFFDGRAQPDHMPLARDGVDLMQSLSWTGDERRTMERIYYHAFIRCRDGHFMNGKLRDRTFP